MSKTSWIIFVAVVVVLFGGLVIWNRTSNPPVDTSEVDASSILSASDASGGIGDHVKGTASSKVVLVEYGDFQCPSCSRAHTSVDQLMDEYGDRIAFVFRNFPLTSIHPNARAASGAAEAAGLQGKFWEMYDLLFTNQANWSPLDSSQRTTVFTGYAEQLGLDIAKFSEDFAGSAIGKKISFDVSLGKRNGVESTPNFFLNGKTIDNTASSSFVNGDSTALKELIDKALAE